MYIAEIVFMVLVAPWLIRAIFRAFSARKVLAKNRYSMMRDACLCVKCGYDVRACKDAALGEPARERRPGDPAANDERFDATHEVRIIPSAQAFAFAPLRSRERAQDAMLIHSLSP